MIPPDRMIPLWMVQRIRYDEYGSAIEGIDDSGNSINVNLRKGSCIPSHYRFCDYRFCGLIAMNQIATSPEIS